MSEEIAQLSLQLSSRAYSPRAKEANQVLVDLYGMKNTLEAKATSYVLDFMPNDKIPEHLEEHLEKIVCLSGTYQDGEGRTYGAGDVVQIHPGESHSIVARERTRLFVQWCPELTHSEIAQFNFL